MTRPQPSQAPRALAATLAVLCATCSAHPGSTGTPPGLDAQGLDSGAAFLLADIQPGASATHVSSGPSGYVAVGSTLFFTADVPGLGRELWKTDGTAAGTVLVKDIAPGPLGAVSASELDAFSSLFPTPVTGQALEVRGRNAAGDWVLVGEGQWIFGELVDEVPGSGIAVVTPAAATEVPK